MERRIKQLLSIAVLVFGASVAMAHYWLFPEPFMSLQLLSEPQPVPAFELRSAPDRLFTEQALKGQWTLLFFGYSHCVDICPVELQIFNQVLNKNPKNVQAIFVSLDPERDSFATLQGFTEKFNRNIKAVTGKHQTLAKLMRSFGADYSRNLMANGAFTHIPSGVELPQGSARDYDLVHSNRIYVVDSRGYYVGSFPSPQNAEKISADLQMIINR